MVIAVGRRRSGRESIAVQHDSRRRKRGYRFGPGCEEGAISMVETDMRQDEQMTPREGFKRVRRLRKGAKRRHNANKHVQYQTVDD